MLIAFDKRKQVSGIKMLLKIKLVFNIIITIVTIVFSINLFFPFLENIMESTY